ncbi:hypothetical protein [Methylobacterium iners]|uniref:hypothetical protein n=1 Tax=Methylobacterium iners TaxID=418707 RepID=UPI001EE1EE5A|nr:hypothetical protein [Methylobacterium iners]
MFATVLFNLFISHLANGSPGAIRVAKDVMRNLPEKYDRKASFERLKGMVAREKAGRQRIDRPAELS